MLGVLLAAFATWYRVTHYRPPQASGTVRTRGVPGERDTSKIEVLNASNGAGLARIATWRLRDRGLDVVYFGSDTAQALDSTQILVRRGDPEVGERVQRALGLGSVRTVPEPTRLVDVTVRLGRDFRSATLARDP